RLRAIENDRWLVRAASSGRSEVISPRGVPSAAGVEVGAVGHVVLPFAHRHSRTPGGRLAWLGPAAAAATVLFLLGCCLGKRREADRPSPGPDDGPEARR